MIGPNKSRSVEMAWKVSMPNCQHKIEQREGICPKRACISIPQRWELEALYVINSIFFVQTRALHRSCLQRMLQDVAISTATASVNHQLAGLRSTPRRFSPKGAKMEKLNKDKDD